jgi:hypothetical protein
LLGGRDGLIPIRRTDGHLDVAELHTVREERAVPVTFSGDEHEMQKPLPEIHPRLHFVELAVQGRVVLIEKAIAGEIER